MRTSNAMQLKAMINKKARELGVHPQRVMQNYLLERLLERVSASDYSDRIIVKGGMLIGSLLGLERRTSMDLDTTVRGLELTREKASEVFRGICAVRVDDDITFEVTGCEDIRETDDYPGLRVHLMARYGPMATPLKVDVTTGDRITPSAVAYDYPLLFDERSIHIMSYPVETVMAEKLETVLSRGIANTRLRDYYDIHMLWLMRRDRIDLSTLGEVLAATVEKRGSAPAASDFEDVMDAIRNDASMTARWNAYAKGNDYSKDLSFETVCTTTLEVLRALA